MVTYLKSPAPDSFTTDPTPNLSWVGIPGATSFWLEMSANADLSSPIVLEQNIAEGERTFVIPETSTLTAGDYYWAMKYQRDGLWSDYSLTWKFTVTTTCAQPPALDTPVTDYLTAVPDIDLPGRKRNLLKDIG